jgi:hypothetical protein
MKTLDALPEGRSERVAMLIAHASELGITLRRLARIGGMDRHAARRWQALEFTPSNLSMRQLLGIGKADAARSHKDAR